MIATVASLSGQMIPQSLVSSMSSASADAEILRNPTGVERSKDAALGADVVVMVVSASDGWTASDDVILGQIWQDTPSTSGRRELSGPMSFRGGRAESREEEGPVGQEVELESACQEERLEASSGSGGASKMSLGGKNEVGDHPVGAASSPNEGVEENGQIVASSADYASGALASTSGSGAFSNGNGASSNRNGDFSDGSNASSDGSGACPEQLGSRQKRGPPAILVINKVDQAPQSQVSVPDSWRQLFTRRVATCARDAVGLEDLERALLDIVGAGEAFAEGISWAVNQVIDLAFFWTISGQNCAALFKIFCGLPGVCWKLHAGGLGNMCTIPNARGSDLRIL